MQKVSSPLKLKSIENSKGAFQNSIGIIPSSLSKTRL